MLMLSIEIRSTLMLGLKLKFLIYVSTATYVSNGQASFNLSNAAPPTWIALIILLEPLLFVLLAIPMTLTMMFSISSMTTTGSK
jgi:uncharacterized membrane protein YhdT